MKNLPPILLMAMVLLSSVLHAEAVQPTPALTPQDSLPFASFSELKNSVVSKIGSASSRIWLVTDFLSDGDIVSSIHLAKYRKVDVQVLLGQKKANAYMSRLATLKNQDIPTYMKPVNLSPTGQTWMLIDEQLLIIDGDLDFMTRKRAFVMRNASSAQSQDFKVAFQAAVSQRLDVQPSPVPPVGKKPRNSQWGKAYVPVTETVKPPTEKRSETVKSASAPASQPSGMTTEHYRYRRGSHEPRPAGIPNKLPKELKWKEIERARKNQENPPGNN